MSIFNKKQPEIKATQESATIVQFVDNSMLAFKEIKRLKRRLWKYTKHY